MTSRKTSFFLYLMPSDLQETALVTVAGGRGAPVSSLCPSWVMYLRDDTAEAERKQRFSENPLKHQNHQTLTITCNSSSFQGILGNKFAGMHFAF